MKLAAVFTLLALIALVPASHVVWGKGHVPLKKVQVCHEGETITVNKSALEAHLGHGDCLLPSCDFNNVYHTGEPCPTEGGGSACILPNERDSAEGQTPGCPAGSY